ncbi:hypothetical protein R3W88_016535 [Solanum pinnatisectum]|uniref:MADS-box domain-containing protein n=1 Tax=Solanum pinnatisectum TaxID=50273 RepID=A0AAV9L1V4_9SOLN|nr:hypothetical protein R3W88_016535 [Solanum pinnatisectum]
MPRNKVIFALTKNETDRKVSHKKRLKGFLKNAQELMTLCDIEMAAIIYSPYSDEPKVFPNHDKKNMVKKDEFTEERTNKLEKNLLKIRKENRVKEITNEMHEVLNGKTISVDMNPCYLNDLSYVIKKNLEQVCDAMKNNEIPPMGTLIQMNNSHNYSSDIPESPSLIELLNWNNDDVVTLLDDLSLNNINDQDPKPTNNI